jgi:hypothetical protein
LPEENNTAVVHNRRTIGQEDKRETTVTQSNTTSTVPVKLYRMDGWMDGRIDKIVKIDKKEDR